MSPIRQQLYYLLCLLLVKGKNKITASSRRTIRPFEDPFSAMTRSMDLESETSQPSNTTGRLLEAANNNVNQSQMLSLSLNSPILDPNQYNDYRQRNINSDFPNPGSLVIPGESPLPAGIGNSRYLRPAQSLLVEVVRVCDNVKGMPNDDRCLQKSCGGGRCALELRAEICGNEATSADKVEIQAKLAKLIYLQEEVESRFESYYHRMEEAVTSFEAVAGLGAAKSYTSLALQAMSWHFCNLRLAIASQIKVTRRKLFDNNQLRISSGLSRLSLLDHEMRRKRFSLQQLGSIQDQQSQALWPIRGLPETSAVILRGWLFEHILHPYPNDSEKLTLASQTGLSKNQVSNWFINARVRLWKPMIEEMYNAVVQLPGIISDSEE